MLNRTSVTVSLFLAISLILCSCSGTNDKSKATKETSGTSTLSTSDTQGVVETSTTSKQMSTTTVSSTTQVTTFSEMTTSAFSSITLNSIEIPSENINAEIYAADENAMRAYAEISSYLALSQAKGKDSSANKSKVWVSDEIKADDSPVMCPICGENINIRPRLGNDFSGVIKLLFSDDGYYIKSVLWTKNTSQMPKQNTLTHEEAEKIYSSTGNAVGCVS